MGTATFQTNPVFFCKIIDTFGVKIVGDHNKLEVASRGQNAIVPTLYQPKRIEIGHNSCLRGRPGNNWGRDTICFFDMVLSNRHSFYVPFICFFSLL